MTTGNKAPGVKLGSILKSKDKDSFYLKVDKYTTIQLVRKNQDGTEQKVVLSGELGDCINMFKNDGTSPEFVKYDVVAYNRK